ncbi:hypothetical protein JXA02_05520 [candidate division KSB1 bacterium]|nr:hypothetical protein [candidate division KSB1 bacterium]RQW07936.1 MAG: hypothetical protein EH222_06340 [candidate division KSB1 bacterium]
MITKRRAVLLVFFCLLFFMNAATASVAKDVGRMRNKWLSRVNKNSKSLERLYLKQALLITREEVAFGQQQVVQLIGQRRDLFDGLSSAKSRNLFEHSDRKILDVGALYIEDDQDNITDSLHYVTAWRKVGDDWLREVDIILPMVKTDAVGDDIGPRRAAWVKYANGDDPESMATELFLHDAMYLNNSEMSKGYAEIAKRLSFIVNSTFHINLTEKQVYGVDDRTIIDIGNWITAEFVGYYLILWQKDEHDVWKIYLYFNF